MDEGLDLSNVAASRHESIFPGPTLDITEEDLIAGEWRHYLFSWRWTILSKVSVCCGKPVIKMELLQESAILCINFIRKWMEVTLVKLIVFLWWINRDSSSARCTGCIESVQACWTVHII